MYKIDHIYRYGGTFDISKLRMAKFCSFQCILFNMTLDHGLLQDDWDEADYEALENGQGKDTESALTRRFIERCFGFPWWFRKKKKVVFSHQK